MEHFVVEHLRRAGVLGGPHMQWLCEAALVGDALRAAATLERSHGIGIDLWRITDWAALAEEGVACEQRWLLGQQALVNSRFEQLMAATQGPILAITLGPRSAPELLRAFAPAGRRYLSLALGGRQGNTAAILQAALRLADEEDGEWIRLAVT